jgi:hypothetical protein
MEKLHIQNFTKRTLQAKSPMFIRLKLRGLGACDRVKLEMCTFGDRRRGHTKAPNLPPGQTLAHFPKTQLLGIGLKKKVLLDCQTEKELLHGIV